MATINPETGLPELPEGYFWKVTKGSESLSYWVHLMRRDSRTRIVTRHSDNRFKQYLYSVSTELGLPWGNTTESYSIDSTEDNEKIADLNKFGILGAAISLERRFIARRMSRSAETRLLGEYPPNTLDDGR